MTVDCLSRLVAFRCHSAGRATPSEIISRRCFAVPIEPLPSIDIVAGRGREAAAPTFQATIQNLEFVGKKRKN